MKVEGGRCRVAKRPCWPWAGWVGFVMGRIWTGGASNKGRFWSGRPSPLLGGGPWRREDNCEGVRVGEWMGAVRYVMLHGQALGISCLGMFELWQVVLD